MQRTVDLKRPPEKIIERVEVQETPAPIRYKQSITVGRTLDDKFEVAIFGTNNRHDVRLLLRAVEKEVNIRKRRAIPLTQSAEV